MYNLLYLRWHLLRETHESRGLRDDVGPVSTQIRSCSRRAPLLTGAHRRNLLVQRHLIGARVDAQVSWLRLEGRLKHTFGKFLGWVVGSE